MNPLIFIVVLAVLVVIAARVLSTEDEPREITLLDEETDGLCAALERMEKE